MEEECTLSKLPVVSSKNGSFDLRALAATLPETAETMLLDMRLTDETAASSRLFRVYSEVPAHYHETCDEYLVVISGRARFVVGGAEPVELSPGQMQFFRRGVVHGFPEILEHPFVIFSVDTPRRDPSVVHFVHAADGTAETFLRTVSAY
jgi:mannose-6-phosphate isomerase-like protein (cupin superfamily)